MRFFTRKGVALVVATVLGLGVAGIAVSLKSGASLFRALVYLPYLVPPVASTIAFGLAAPALPIRIQAVSP